MRPSDAAVCGNVALPRRALSAFLRTLWNVEPALLAMPAPAALDEFTNPYLSPAGLHLPAHHTAERHWYRAAAAHAAAHLVYSRQPFERSGLAPVTQALIGVLEDARIEWLACRELPGLRALWLAHHAAPEEHGEGFEALMRRLARSLLQPQCSDPHPWVQKGGPTRPNPWRPSRLHQRRSQTARSRLPKRRSPCRLEHVILNGTG